MKMIDLMYKYRSIVYKVYPSYYDVKWLQNRVVCNLSMWNGCV